MNTVKKMNLAQLAANLTAHGYGMPATHIERILSKLHHTEVEDLMYACRRAAVKLGPEAFTDDPRRDL